VQYALYVKRLFLGDEYGWPGLGLSYNTRSPVRDEIFDRAWVTIQLAIGAAILWLILGVSIGVISALKRRTAVDRAAMGFALIGVSAPVFWLGLVALYIFWEKLGWLPGTGYVPFTESPTDWFLHMLLPWCVLALLFAAVYARVVRGNMLDTMGEDYIRTARAKGLPERRVVGRHGLRPGLTPVVTLLAIDLALLVGNTVVTETVFNMPGLGNYILISTDSGDLPGVLAVVVLASFAVAFLALVADIVYAYLDPRVRYR
jgi:peptide/nickel transport system permease protein